MTGLDWVALGLVGFAALSGAARGFVWSGLSLAGLVGGAILGGRLASHLLDRGAGSPYSPLIALAGAAGLAMLLEALGSAAGASFRSRLRFSSLRALDSAGGLIAGALTGFAVVWVVGAVGLQLPGQTKFRREIQRSLVLRKLNSIVPPRTFLHALARIDPLPVLTGPGVPAQPPNPRVLRADGPRRAAPSVVRVLGTSCGLGVEGSGWVAGRGIVVTAAHVVAGEKDTTVVSLSGGRLRARAIVFDPRNDLAVLRAPGLSERALSIADPRPEAAVAILGYPENGPLDAVPGRIGTTATVLSEDAYGRGPVLRAVTSFSGLVRHGDSGGPAVDATGAVQATVFAARTDGRGGFGVPASLVRPALASTSGPVSTGPCAP
ncbi:MAG TPA: MarP family serine protease [Gaiellaceae bacterium]